MKKLSKILAVLLLLCMLMSIMPVASFASDVQEPESQEQQEENAEPVNNDGQEENAEPEDKEETEDNSEPEDKEEPEEKEEEKAEEKTKEEKPVFAPFKAPAPEHTHNFGTPTAEGHICSAGGCEYETLTPHTFPKGSNVCSVCNYECVSHEWNAVKGTCKVCGIECEHRYSGGECQICGKIQTPVAYTGVPSTASYKEYKNIGDAFANMNEGDTVTVLTSFSTTADSSLAKSGTLNLNGKSIQNGSAGKGSISVTAGTVVIKGGKLDLGDASKAALTVNGGSVTLQNVTVSNKAGNAVDMKSGSLSIESGSLSDIRAEGYVAAGKMLIYNASTGMYDVTDKSALTVINPNLSVKLGTPVYKDGLTAANFPSLAELVKSLADDSGKIDGVAVDNHYTVDLGFAMKYVYDKPVIGGGSTTVSFKAYPELTVSFNNGANKTAVPVYDDAIKSDITLSYTGLQTKPTQFKHTFAGGAADVFDVEAYNESTKSISVATSKFVKDASAVTDVNDKFVISYETPASSQQDISVNDGGEVKFSHVDAAVNVNVKTAVVESRFILPGTNNIINVSGAYAFESSVASVMEALNFPAVCTVVRIPNDALVNANVDGTFISVITEGTDRRGVTAVFNCDAVSSLLNDLGSNDLLLVLGGTPGGNDFSIKAIACGSADVPVIELKNLSNLIVGTTASNDFFGANDVTVSLEVSGDVVPYTVEHAYGSKSDDNLEYFYNSADTEKQTDAKTFTYDGSKVTFNVRSFSKFHVVASPVTVTTESLEPAFFGSDRNSLIVSADYVGSVTWHHSDSPVTGMSFSTSGDTLVLSGAPTDSNQIGKSGLTFTCWAEDSVGNRSEEKTFEVKVVDGAVYVSRYPNGGAVGDGYYATLADAVAACNSERVDCELTFFRNTGSEDVTIGKFVRTIMGGGFSTGSLSFTSDANVTVTNLKAENITVDSEASVNLIEVTASGTVTSRGSTVINGGTYGTISGDGAERVFTVYSGEFTNVTNASGTKLSEFPMYWLGRESYTDGEGKTCYSQSIADYSSNKYYVLELYPAITACDNSHTYVKNSTGTLTFTTNIPYSVIETYYNVGLETDDDGYVIGIPNFKVYAGTSGDTLVSNSSSTINYVFAEDNNGFLTVTLSNVYLKGKSAGTYFLSLKTDMGEKTPTGDESKYYVSATGKTGDTSNMGLWIGIMVAVVVAAVVIVIVLKKQGKLPGKNNNNGKHS